MMPKKARNKIRIRRTWTRSPVQKPHSTPKGVKGYNRKIEKDKARKTKDGEKSC